MLDLAQNLLLTIASFVVVLSLVVFVHEFGHFQVGRWCGIAVKSFSIGLGGEWFGWTDKRGTRWKISKIPLGGFVSWIDDTDGSSTLPASEEHQALSHDEARRRGHFRAMPIWKRTATVAAGPLTNFVFAIFAFAVLGLIFGRDATDHANVRVQFGEANAGSVAQAAGLRAGEIVEEVDGRPIRGQDNFIAFVDSHGGRPLSLTLSRADGARRTVQVTPRALKEGGRLGITVGEYRADFVVVPVSLLEALPHGAVSTWENIARTGAYIGGIFTGRESGSQIAGPIGIANITGQVANSALDAPSASPLQRVQALLLSLLNLAAILSIAVGIVNLLPIPVLDGGHLMFYAIEAARGGRPLPPVAQEWAYRAGFAVMASLFLFATWNDITRLFPSAQ
jgi:regulator of sigma E protease